MENKRTNSRSKLLQHLAAKGYVVTPADVGGRRLPLVISDGASIGFVPLPADPSVPLTEQQLDSLFPPENRAAFVRQIAALARAKADENAA